MTYLTRVLINDFHAQLSIVLLPQQVVDKEFLGHICTAMMLNEIEIIAWCFTIYKILNEYDSLGTQLVKFNDPEELVIACAIFSKVCHII